MAAAASYDMLAGLSANLPSIAHAYSAKAPRQTPNTSSPGLNWVTFLPTSSIWPAMSLPTRGSLGLRSPVSMRRRYGTRKRRSTGLTEAARIFIRTSSSFGIGFAASVNCSTSGGPYRVQTIAFIRSLGGGLWQCGFIVPGSRRWTDQSRNVRASFAVTAPAPRASCAPSALACGGEHWREEGREHAYQGRQTKACREQTVQ